MIEQCKSDARPIARRYQQIYAKLLFVISCIVAATYAFCASAQQARFTRLTSADGLPQNTISDIVQDRQGYIWLATGDGLVRYDGHETRVFRHDPDRPDSLSDNYLLSLVEDRDGMVWVGTAGAGLDRLDPHSGAVRHFRHTEDDPTSLPDDRDVRALAVDAEGGLWVGTANGLAHKPLGGDHFEPIILVDPIISGRQVEKILTIHVGPSGTVYVSTAQHGVYAYYGADPAAPKNTFTKLPLQTMAVSALHEDDKGGLWLGTEADGLFYLPSAAQAADQRQLQAFSLPDNEVTALLPGDNGKLWVGSWNSGLISFDPDTGQTIPYRHSLADPHSIGSNAVVSLMRDRGGMIWAGTYDRGVSRFSPDAVFAHYYLDPLQEASLPNNTVWAFAENADGTVWTGTAGGLGLFSPAQGRFIPFASPVEANGLLTKTDIRAVELVGESLWIGTWGKGLLHVQLDTGAFTQYVAQPDLPNSLSHNRVRLILPDRDGTLWVGTQAGLNQLDPQTGQFTRYTHNPDDSRTLPNDRIRALHLARDGTLWVGTSGGLSRRNPDGSFTSWNRRNSPPGHLHDDDIRDIHEARDGTFWLATGHGLTHFDPAEGPVKTYGERAGFRNTTLYGILPDQSGRLWISTNFGLARFDTTTKAIQIYTADQGLQDNEFNFGAFGKLRNGLMLFGGINGFNLFDPNRASADPPANTAPILALTEVVIQASDGSQRSERPAEGQPVNLSYRDKKLTIRLAAFEYDRPTATRYQMWLQGLDVGWSEFRTDLREIHLNALAPGTYHLRAKAMAADGALSQNQINLPLTVDPAPWQTVWAYLAYVALGCSAFTALYFARTRILARDAARLRREVERQTVEVQHKAAEIVEKNAELRTLLASRNRLYRTLSHELRTPLAVVLSGLQLLTSGQNSDGAQVAAACLSSCRRLNRMVDKLLVLAKTDQPTSDDQTHQPIEIVRVIQPLLPGFKMLAAARAVEFVADIGHDHWVMASAEALELIVQNLVANAVHHTPAGGQVSLQIRNDLGTIVLTVADTGVGIAPEHHTAIFDEFYRISPQNNGNPTGAGLGLALVRVLVQRLGGTISVDSQLGQGAVFTATFQPVDQPTAAALPAITATHDDGATGSSEPALPTQDAQGPLGTLVIIEDDPTLAKWLPTLLADEFTCHIVTAAETALAVINQKMPDAIVCDVMLQFDPQDRSGFDLAEAIRQDVTIGHIPIVLLTALNDSESRLSGINRGIDDYITKPFDNVELRTRLRNIIENRRKTREHLKRSLTSVEPTAALKTPPSLETSLEAGLADDITLNEVSHTFLVQLEQRVREAIFDDQASLPDIAATFGISERQLQRRVRDICGLSFTKFRNAIRMRDARHLLTTDKPVTEIAHQLGFNSAAHFSLTFRKAHQVAPTEWRRKLSADTTPHPADSAG